MLVFVGNIGNILLGLVGNTVSILLGFLGNTVGILLEIPGTALYMLWRWSSRNDIIALLDRNKDMSVHVSNWTVHDLNSLTPVAWKLWRW